jgi:hypothetical protein
MVVGAVVITIGLVGLTPRFAIPSVPTGHSDPHEDTTLPVQPADAEQIQDEWHQLQEELLQLDADLAQANKLFHSTTRQPEAAQQMLELNRQAAALRARRSHITSLLEKDSQR